MKDLFLREGFPSTVISDNGVQFVSQGFESFLVQSGIEHSKSALYYPQTNGLVERMNRVLNNCVQWALAGKCNVQNAVRSMLWFYRTTPHSSTKVSPYELLRGRKPCSKVCPGWMSRWVKLDSIHDMDEFVRHNVSRAQSRQKLHFDSRKSYFAQPFVVGDDVRISERQCNIF